MSGFKNCLLGLCLLTSLQAEQIAKGDKAATREGKDVAISTEVNRDLVDITRKLQVISAKGGEQTAIFQSFYDGDNNGNNNSNAADVLGHRIDGGLFALSYSLYNLDCNGNGNVDYWIRTYNMLARHGMNAEGVIGDFTANHGNKMHPMLNMALGNLKSSFNRVSYAYSNGYGDVDYWMDAACRTSKQLKALQKDVEQVRQSLPKP